MSDVKSKLRLYDDSYSEETYTDVNRLANALLTQSDMLTSAVTNLYGRFDDRFPLMMMTEGRNKVKKIKSADGSYKLPVIGKPKKHSIVTRCYFTSSDTTIGKGKVVFKVGFADNWFPKGYTIESKNGTKAVVQKEAVKNGNVWEHELKLVGANTDSVIPYAEVAVGAKWALMYRSVGISNSIGSSSRNQAPSMVTNQTTFLRMSYNYRGNVENKVAVIELPKKGGGTTTLWTEWEAYLNSLKFREDCENFLWYGEYNRDANGVIHDTDPDTGEMMPIGAGILDQIPNSSTYSILTETRIKNTLRDVFYNSNANAKKDIEIFVGTGSRDAFSAALTSALQGLSFQATDDKWVSGAPNSNTMVYGAYFNTYKHVDGHTATIRYLPLLDHGSRAQAADLHPEGLPVTSYDMYFVDNSVIDGEQNLMFVCEEGRENIECVVPGLTMPRGYGKSVVRASDRDASSVQYAKSIGVHMKNPVNSFKLTTSLVA